MWSVLRTEEVVGRGPSPEAQEELFRAARALLTHGVIDEDQIIPTLVFAAASDREERFAKVRARFAEAPKRASEAARRKASVGRLIERHANAPLRAPAYVRRAPCES